MSRQFNYQRRSKMVERFEMQRSEKRKAAALWLETETEGEREEIRVAVLHAIVQPAGVQVLTWKSDKYQAYVIEAVNHLIFLNFDARYSRSPRGRHIAIHIR